MRQRMTTWVSAVAVLAAATPAGIVAEEPAAAVWERNRASLMAYFDDEVSRLTEESSVRIASVEDWPEKRETYRRHLADMLGMPSGPFDSPLNAEVTGTLEHELFTVEKLHFQAKPGLYVTGNLYVPKELNGPAPAILYLCGHARRVEDGVSYGNKTAYQRHPAWFARHGYVALVVDTIQLGEIQGLHHGTHRQGMWWWNSRGYSVAGVEAFNAMRAIDYLETREEVDPERIGVTGRSGGGIGTLYLAALDERVAVAAPVAGITDIRNHVVDHLTPRHCDCNYFPNIHRFDYARIASLIAPRPLMIANSDRDAIFPLDGVQRVHAEVREVYRALGAEEELALVITPGVHRDTQPLRVPVFSWFNRHLKGDESLIERPAVPFFEDSELRVFDELPEDEIVTRIHETFVPEAGIGIPADTENWRAQRDGFRRALEETVFRNRPEPAADRNGTRALSVEREGVLLEAWDYSTERHVDLRLYLLRAGGADPEHLVLDVGDEVRWREFLATAGHAFGDELPDYWEVEPDESAFDTGRRFLEEGRVAYAFLAPRGIGPHAWAEPGSRDAVHLRRSFPILGRTLDGQRVFDVMRALAVLREIDGTAGLAPALRGERDMAGVALYAAILDGGVERLFLHEPPDSHSEGPELPQVLRFFDLPQAVALVLEHAEVNLSGTAEESWAYAARVAELTGRPDRLRIEEGGAGAERAR